jgi:hypothetical protein
MRRGDAAILLAHDAGANRAQPVVRQELRSKWAHGFVVHNAHDRRQIPQLCEHHWRKVIGEVADERDVGTKFALDLAHTCDSEGIDDLKERLSGNTIASPDLLMWEHLVVQRGAACEKSHIVAGSTQ